MDVRLLTHEGVEQHPVEDLKALLDRDDGLVWVDIPVCDEPATTVLAEVFGFHRLAVRECVVRNRVPKSHAYPDHVFVVLHAPELGKAGHIHYIELDQFIGPRYLVTVHGPLNAAVDPEVSLRETQAVLRRVRAGRLHPSSSFELSYAIVCALARHQEAFVEILTREVWQLEQRVTGGDLGDPEQFLEEMFQARHGLLAVRTMGVLSSATYGRMANVARCVPADAQPLLADAVDQFDRVSAVADGQKDYLQGVIDFYRTRTETHTTIAAERLAATAVQQNDDMRRITAWVAIIAVPTAVTGFFGQNVPYPGFGQTTGFLASSLIMLTVAIALYVIFKHKKWL